MDGVEQIDTITAFIATDTDGTEGIIGSATRYGVMPLVAADPDRVESLRPIAEAVARGMNVPVRLVQFTTRTVLEEDILTSKESSAS